MKKYITLIVLSIFLSNLQGQILKSYGIKAGGTITSQFREIEGFPELNFYTDNKFGTNFGAYCEFIDDSVFSIVIEVNYIQNAVQKEAWGFQHPPPLYTNLWSLRIDYIGFSILGKAKEDFGFFSPYFLFGPCFNIEINKSVQNDISSVYNDFNKKRFGLKFGVGTELKLSGLNFLAEFIYNLHFGALFKNETVKITSNSYDFRIGVFFNP